MYVVKSTPRSYIRPTDDDKVICRGHFALKDIRLKQHYNMRVTGHRRNLSNEQCPRVVVVFLPNVAAE